MPALEIWADGVLETSTMISSSGSMIGLTINFAGALPSSLGFTFDDAFVEAGRRVEIQSVKINNRHINVGNYLSDNDLSKGDTATVDVGTSDYIFDPSEPDPTDFACDTIYLTNSADRYRNYSGADLVIDGQDGRDSILVGSGADRITSGAGNDMIRSGGGNDLLYGVGGNDRLYGGEGDDEIYGGNDDDQLYGEDGDDELFGNEGNDKIVGGIGLDTLAGGQGNDRIFGGIGDDIIYGDEGDDVVVAGTGNDTIDGGDGADMLRGGDGDDIIDGGVGNDVIFGGLGSNILYGRDGNDIIYGASDQNIIYGNAGVDTIYSGSLESLDDTISNILANNAGVVYSSETNSFYQYISTDVTWVTAMSSSVSSTLVGLPSVNGHLLTITSALENSYIDTYLGVEDSWLAATDITTEGEWFWVDGPESNTQFWTGGASGSSVNSLYSEWAPSEPSNFVSTWDYGVILGSGDWLADRNIAPGGFVIEWEADSLLTTVDRTFIDSGAGADSIYLADGVDVISFSDASSIDTIYDFDITDRDSLDIDDIISYDPLNDDLSDFIQLAESGGNTTMSIDANGLTGGASFTDIAVLDGVTGLDVQAMISGENLIVA